MPNSRPIQGAIYVHPKTETRVKQEADLLKAAKDLKLSKRKQTQRTIKMTNMIKNFAADESGAVTVDFVVLTAAIVGLSIALMSVLSTGVGNLTDQIETELAGQVNAD